MATAKLILKKSKDSKTHQVLLRYSHEGKRVYFYTKERVSLKAWDAKNQKLRASDKIAEEINRNLQSLKNDIEALVRDRRFQGLSLSATDIKEAFEEIKDPEKRINKNDLIAMLEAFIKANPNKLAGNTLEKYHALLTNLKTYKEKGNEVTFNAVNKEFANDFRDYLNSADEKEKKKAVTDNSVVSYLGALTAFLKYHGIKRDLKINIKEREKVVIFLTLPEVLQIRALDLKEGTALSNVRDLFLFGCFTGMRYSDIVKLHKANIRDGFIIYSAAKTENETIVPINKYALEILEKYDYKLPFERNKLCNEYVKKLAALAKLEEETVQIRYTGNKRKEVVAKKHELLTFHASRSSFIMIHLAKGFGSEVVMAQSGHKDFRSFKRYIRITKPMLKDVAKVVFD